ncbi:hypothetical protein [Herpetosiphon giganteus]|uniref:hypothetical protein n=1 Tax=Herpetosiphon giganteus TaxID=2029754 RepID=UPI0019586A23|nr:hypothetical protein [Herpetosiphon giganteus]MBM7845708.1 hypothetical protein [Herpetosiphon giganteus]
MPNQPLALDEQAIVQAASDSTTTPEELLRIANYLALVADPDFERPTSGTDFLRFVGRQGPLAVVLEPHPRTAIVAALVANPNTPQKTLLHFAADFPEAFLANPVLLLLLLEHPDLFRQMDELRLLVFLRHPAIPLNLLNTIRGYASPDVAQAIAYHINSYGEAGADWQQQAEALVAQLPLPPVDGQEALIEHLALGTLPAWLEQRLLASNEQHIQQALQQTVTVLEDEVFAAMSYTINHERFDLASIATADREQRKRAAESSDPEILRLLADDDDPSVRARVAFNINTPLAVLPRLELDDVQPVRNALALNPNVPAALLATMARDYSWSALRMRKAIAQHPNVTPDILARLATDESIQVRNAVVRNPQTSASARQQLLDRALTAALYSAHPMFHFIAMANQYTNPQHLRKGLRSPYWYARYALALNPAVPLEIISELTNDAHCFVRRAAQTAREQRVKEQA